MAPDLAHDVAALRDFNRFYTRRIGLLNEAHLDSGFSLAEVRVLFELDRTDGLSAKTLGETLDMDAGYLSRILKRFEMSGLVTRVADPQDGRSHRLRLTAQGRAAFQPINARSDAQTGALIAPLGAAGRSRLRGALADIRGLMDAAPSGTVSLRPHRIGDIGWIIERHGVLYAAEHGWPVRFEGLVAGICAEFLRDFDPGRERCWIAESEGERLGCVFLQKGATPTEAKLRLLLLEPAARGKGLGRRLTRTCIDEARALGCRRLTLWTQSVLTTARTIYASEGFALESSEAHAMFGVDLIGETWALAL